jgi:hypothetical protein
VIESHFAVCHIYGGYRPDTVRGLALLRAPRMGGKARARKLSRRRRREIAMLGVEARRKKRATR